MLAPGSGGTWANAWSSLTSFDVTLGANNSMGTKGLKVSLVSKCLGHRLSCCGLYLVRKCLSGDWHFRSSEVI